MFFKSPSRNVIWYVKFKQSWHYCTKTWCRILHRHSEAIFLYETELYALFGYCYEEPSWFYIYWQQYQHTLEIPLFYLNPRDMGTCRCLYLRNIWLISRRRCPSLSNPKAGECNKFQWKIHNVPKKKIQIKYILNETDVLFISLGLGFGSKCLRTDIGLTVFIWLFLGFSPYLQIVILFF